MRKKDGSDYKPDSDRHLKETGSSISIAKYKEFVNSRKLLEGKAHSFREQGFGKRHRALKELPIEDELEMLWSKGLLDSRFPRSLKATMRFVLMQHLRLRGCQEHHDMNRMSKIVYSAKTTMASSTYVECTYKENPTEKKRKEMKSNVLCHLAVTERSKSRVWYKRQRMEIHTINSFMKSIAV